RTLGAHPDDGQPVTAQKGRYGPYVKHGGINATLPKGLSLEEIALDKAVELLRAQAEKKGANGKAGKKPAAKAKSSTKAKTAKSKNGKTAKGGGRSAAKAAE